MNGYTSTLERRLTKLENSKLGTPAFAGCVRLIVHEDEDADDIIRQKTKAGEIRPDTLVIVRQIVGLSAFSESERLNSTKR
jgi:hypothetical protein